MMRSMFAGVSALRNHQTQMDVIGNNIANVNTIGYKGSRVIFQEMLSQTIRGAGSPDHERNIGGTNPMQVGLGMNLGSIDTFHTQGNIQSTGREEDLAIEGDGFFVITDGQRNFYTRAGAFDLDSHGNLVSPGGFKVIGWMADAYGQIDDDVSKLTTLSIPANKTLDPIATGEIVYGGNLSAATNGQLSFDTNPIDIDVGGETVRLHFTLTQGVNFNEWQWEATVVGGEFVDQGGNVIPYQGQISVDNNGNFIFDIEGSPTSVRIISENSGADVPIQFNSGQFEVNNIPVSELEFTPAPTRTAPVEVYDSLGNRHGVELTFTKVGNNQWKWQAGGTTIDGVQEGNLTFNSNGHLIAADPTTITLTLADGETQEIELNFEGLTQFAGPTTAEVSSQNGFPEGTLEGYSIDQQGVITGRFSNGLTQPIGMVALAIFANPGGLQRAGNSLFEETGNSGMARIGAPGTGSRGSIAPGSVEMSNIDLSQEFTNMIISQRGFQANSRIITTSDEMLQELVNLKR
ncbi:MAG: flagellar hook protein FlgE [Limnochordia bacterium]|jgi:flagellar hook protein FlgE